MKIQVSSIKMDNDFIYHSRLLIGELIEHKIENGKAQILARLLLILELFCTSAPMEQV